MVGSAGVPVDTVAELAGWKAKGEIRFLGAECLGHSTASSGEPAHDRSDRQIERLGCLGVGEARDVDRGEDVAEILRERATTANTSRAATCSTGDDAAAGASMRAAASMSSGAVGRRARDRTVSTHVFRSTPSRYGSASSSRAISRGRRSTRS